MRLPSWEQLRGHLTYPGLAPWRKFGLIETAVESMEGWSAVSTRSSLCGRISGLTRNVTAEASSRDQILRHKQSQGNFPFPLFS